MSGGDEWRGYRFSVRTSDGAAMHYLAIAKNEAEAREALQRRWPGDGAIEVLEDPSALARARELRIPDGHAFEDGS